MTKEQNYVNELIQLYRSQLPLEKYDMPGVYSITVDNEIVYVGKARNMATRIANHMYLIKDAYLKTEGEKFKYGELRRALRNDYIIYFNVLYSSDLSNEEEISKIDDDIGPQEAKFINMYMPKLNKQIPDLNDYHKYHNKSYEMLNIIEKNSENIVTTG